MSVGAAELEARAREGALPPGAAAAGEAPPPEGAASPEAPPPEDPDPWAVHEEALARLDGAAVALCRAAAAFLEEVAAASGRVRPWQEGYQDLPHLVASRYGFAAWKAHRAVEAARALRGLPGIRGALRRGELSFDKVLELCRFARPGEEERLLAWARGASVGEVRYRADQLRAAGAREERRLQASRSLRWWHEERAFRLSAALPPADGALLVRALEEATREVPLLPGEGSPSPLEARRADALVTLARAYLGGRERPVPATVVVHARWDALTRGRRGAHLAEGVALNPEVASRLACTSKIEVLFEGEDGRVLARSALRRRPPAWMVRELLRRRPCCAFPGCGRRRYLEIHHLQSFGRGGPTTLENLAPLCAFHHKLPHELGWGFRRAGGREVWTRPNGMPYGPGPSPPPEVVPRC